MSEEERPLNQSEIVELDAFGSLSMRNPLGIPARAMELWEREILYGREGEPAFKGLLTR